MDRVSVDSSSVHVQSNSSTIQAPLRTSSLYWPIFYLKSTSTDWTRDPNLWSKVKWSEEVTAAGHIWNRAADLKTWLQRSKSLVKRRGLWFTADLNNDDRINFKFLIIAHAHVPIFQLQLFDWLLMVVTFPPRFRAMVFINFYPSAYPSCHPCRFQEDVQARSHDVLSETRF